MAKAIDITGQRFGRLIAIEPVGKNTSNNILWRCQCDCGNELITSGTCLRQGVTRSCGCLMRESVIERNKKRSSGLFVKKEQKPEETVITPINRDLFYDWWMFGDNEGQNERWFKKYIA